ncbi:hypothetical protein MTsN3n11_21440 [Qipengyuania sp. MTN3-11]
MEAERISRAMGRIEAALERIERARETNAHAAASSGGNPELVARHEALRESVIATIGELDTLIGRLER